MLKKFNYAQEEQGYLEILFSSLKCACITIKDSYISLVLIATIIMIKLLMLDIYLPPIPQIIVNIVSISLIVIITSIQVQSSIDGFECKINQLLIILRKIGFKLMTTVTLAFGLLLLTANVAAIIMPFLMFSYIIILPVTIFKANNVFEGLKMSWSYAYGNRIMMIYSFFIGYCFLKASRLAFMYLINDLHSALKVPIVILLMTLSCYFLIVQLLVILHNMIMRHENKINVAEQTEQET